MIRYRIQEEKILFKKKKRRRRKKIKGEEMREGDEGNDVSRRKKKIIGKI